ncbi:MAG: hypothetical protein M3Z30_13455 [Gemmatimonadota bacterium]|nr:hypothetical protein [Gemmatimonadota bacterium]
MGAGVAAVIVAKERRIVEAFQSAGATSPERAIMVHDVGVGDGIALRRLRSHAVIREATPGHLYLDQEVWDALRRTRRRMMLVMLVVLLFWVATLAWASLPHP